MDRVRGKGRRIVEETIRLEQSGSEGGEYPWIVLSRLLIFAWYGSIVVELLFAGNLIRTKLAGRYLAFVAWAGVDATVSLLLTQFTHQAAVYLRVYIAGQAIMMLFQFLAIRSIFSAHLSNYPGIGAFGRKLLLVLVCLAVTVSVVVVHSDWRSADNPFDLTITGVRIVMTGFAVFLLASMVFFARVRVPTKGNVLSLERGAAATFALQSMVFLAMVAMGKRLNGAGSLLIELISLFTFTYWVAVLQPSGEEMPEEPVYDPEEHARVEHLNAEALRLAAEIRTAAGRSWR